MKTAIFTTILLMFGLIGLACSGTSNVSTANTPTGAYQRLYAAVKAKNTEAIKGQLSKKSIEMGVMFSQRSGKTIEQAYENGFTATTFSPTMPETRDERIKEDMGALEVWNSKDKVWEDLPFILEDGAWKLAVGDLFADTYKKPAEGQAQKEKEAANAAGQNPVIQAPGPNMNVPVMPIMPNNANTNANANKKAQ